MADFIKDYFQSNEFNCKCNYECGLGAFDMSFNLIMFLWKARDMLGEPLIITSAIRCERHNTDVGGAKDSFHLKGMAVDVRTKDGIFRRELTRLAINDGFTTGIPRSEFVHIDCRPIPIVFGY